MRRFTFSRVLLSVMLAMTVSACTPSISHKPATSVSPEYLTAKKFEDRGCLFTYVENVPKRLTYIALGGDSDLTPAELSQIAQLKTLEVILLSSEKVSDDVILSLFRLPNLRTLILYNASITDQGVAQFPTTSKLRALAICNAAISDSSIGNLVQFKNLHALGLIDTSVSSAGLSRFESECPGVLADVFDEASRCLKGGKFMAEHGALN